MFNGWVAKHRRHLLEDVRAFPMVGVLHQWQRAPLQVPVTRAPVSGQDTRHSVAIWSPTSEDVSSAALYQDTVTI